MLTVERQRGILRLLETQHAARVTSMAEALGVSASTIRRDLDDLAASGALRRVHGGAVLVDGDADDGTAFEPVAVERFGEHAAEKGRIAEAAAALVRPGSTIFVSGGTTTEWLVPRLGSVGPLTVITNAINIAHRLVPLASVETVVLGGILRNSELTLLGTLAEEAVRLFQIELAFFGCYGIDAATGLSGASLQEAATDRTVIAAADRLVVLADHTKFAQRGPVRFADVATIDTLVTDDEAPAEAVARLEQAGVRVVRA